MRNLANRCGLGIYSKNIIYCGPIGTPQTIVGYSTRNHKNRQIAPQSATPTAWGCLSTFSTVAMNVSATVSGRNVD